MAYSYVLAFGGSHTAGCELLPVTDWEKTKELSFPNTLAKKLKIPCINYAWPGGSNDRSLRLLPEALLTYPNSLVLFGMMGPDDRTEFFTLDSEMPQTLNYAIPNNNSDGYAAFGICWDRVQTSKKHRRLNKLYYAEFYEDTTGHNRYKVYNTMLIVQTLCEKYASNYVQFFQDNKILLAPDFQKCVYDALDKSKIYQFDFAQDGIHCSKNNQGYGSLSHWAANKKYQFCPGGHIGQEAHDNFALDLFNII